MLRARDLARWRLSSHSSPAARNIALRQLITTTRLRISLWIYESNLISDIYQGCSCMFWRVVSAMWGNLSLVSSYFQRTQFFRARVGYIYDLYLILISFRIIFYIIFNLYSTIMVFRVNITGLLRRQNYESGGGEWGPFRESNRECIVKVDSKKGYKNIASMNLYI